MARSYFTAIVAAALAGALASACRKAPAPPKQAFGSSSTDAAASDSLVLQLSAAAIKSPFVLRQDPTASQGASLEVPPKAGKAPGEVRLDFVLPQSGRYSLFLRCYWGTDLEDGCSNSVGVRLDDGPWREVEDAVYRRWHWLPCHLGPAKGAPVELAEGPHRLSLRSREDGIKIDQLFVTPWHDDEFDRRIPEGIEE